MQETGFLAAFIAGLMGGVHCFGMCGGIVSALSLNIKHTRKQSVLTFLLAYNSARILSYMLAGALLGGISMLAGYLTDINQWQNILYYFSIVLLFSLGLYLAGWWQGISWLEKGGAVLWRHIKPWSQKLFPVTTLRQAFLLGLLWGWLPCGLVYTILFWSMASASYLNGALMMLCFGLGTLPALLAMGFFATRIQPWIQHSRVRQFAGLVLIGFAVYHLWQVLAR